jgi:hypothetical protein
MEYPLFHFQNLYLLSDIKLEPLRPVGCAIWHFFKKEKNNYHCFLMPLKSSAGGGFNPPLLLVGDEAFFLISQQRPLHEPSLRKKSYATSLRETFLRIKFFTQRPLRETLL